MLSFRKKLMSQSQENLQTDGRMEGQTLFHGTLQAEAGTPINTFTYRFCKYKYSYKLACLWRKHEFYARVHITDVSSVAL